MEERTSEEQFQEYVHRILEIVGGQNIILGVGDMVLENNLIERVAYIANENVNGFLMVSPWDLQAKTAHLEMLYSNIIVWLILTI